MVFSNTEHLSASHLKHFNKDIKSTVLDETLNTSITFKITLMRLKS